MYCLVILYYKPTPSIRAALWKIAMGIYYDIYIIIFPMRRTHGCDEHMQLVRSHYLQPGERLNPSIAVQEYPFDFERLQKDIITSFLSGKPVIVIDNLRKPFKFLLQRRNTLTLGVTEIDIDVLSEYIKDSPEFEVRIHSILCMLYYCRYTLIKMGRYCSTTMCYY